MATKSGQRIALGSESFENVYEGGKTGIIGKILTKYTSSWGLTSVSSVRVKIGDISSGGVKGTLNSGAERPKGVGSRVDTRPCWMYSDIARDGGVGGRDRTIIHCDSLFVIGLTWRDPNRLGGRLVGRDDGLEPGREDGRLAKNAVQSANGSSIDSSHVSA